MVSLLYVGKNYMGSWINPLSDITLPKCAVNLPLEKKSTRYDLLSQNYTYLTALLSEEDWVKDGERLEGVFPELFLPPFDHLLEFGSNFRWVVHFDHLENSSA